MQTAYTREMPIALPGMPADVGGLEKISLLVETAGGLDAGVFCKGGTDKSKQAVAIAAAADITGLLCKGVLMYDATKEPSSAASAGPGHYDAKQMATVVQKGRIWVRLDTGQVPTDGAPVFVRFQAAGADEGVGWARTDDDTTPNAAQLEGAVFRSGPKTVTVFGTAYLIALVELNLPVTA